jgi:diaminopimelate epimerase
VASYLHDNGLVNKDKIVAETSNGILTLYIEEDKQVRVNMGVPRFEPKEIPIDADERAAHYQLSVGQAEIEAAILSMGNPHAVIIVDNVEQAPVQTLAPQVQRHELFPEGVNVGFMQIVDKTHIRLRVYERGAGETLACGSGACAAVVAGCQDGHLQGKIDVELRGGNLAITWEGEGEPVWMVGPATTVYEGRIDL